MSSRIALDASAILAVIHQEPGHERPTPHLPADAVGSAVNRAEVHSKLVGGSRTSDEAWEYATSPVQAVVSFDEEHARIAGDLITQTRGLGLSSGDSACLALALALKAPVYAPTELGKALT